MTVSKYGLSLNTFADIRGALKDVFLRIPQDMSQTGQIAADDELSFWINKAYVLLEDYPWSWARSSSVALALTSGTSKYPLSIQARDKKPILFMSNFSNEIKEVPDFLDYQRQTCNRTGTGVPRRFCYVERDDSVRAYSTGTISGTSGAYLLTGAGTSWKENIFPGSTITPTAGSPLTVARVNSDLEVTLTAALVATINASTTYAASSNYPLNQIDLDPIPNGGSVNYYYAKRFLPLINDSDVPLLPLNDRWVLIDGAYSLYQWFNEKDVTKAGISASVQISNRELFLMSPSTIQKFFNQYVAKLLADDKAISGITRPRTPFKRGY